MYKRVLPISFAVVALAAGTLATGSAAADSTPPGSSTPDDADAAVAVIDAGDPATQIDLNTLPALGDTATIETHAETEGRIFFNDGELDAGAVVDATEMIEVTQVTESGFAASGALAALDTSSAIAEEMGIEDPVLDLVDVPLQYTFANPYWIENLVLGDGAPSGGDYAESVDSFHGMQGFGALALPDEAVGVGATWTAAAPWEYEGEVVPMEAEYTLVSVDNGAYEITFTSDLDDDDIIDMMAPVDTSDQPLSQDGSVSASGTVRGDIDEPLRYMTTMELSMRFEADYADDDRDSEFDLRISVERESTPT